MEQLKVGNYPHNKYGSQLQDVVIILNKIINKIDNINLESDLTSEDIQTIKDFLKDSEFYLKKEDAKNLYTPKAPSIPDIMYGIKDGEWEEITLSWKEESNIN